VTSLSSTLAYLNGPYSRAARINNSDDVISEPSSRVSLHSIHKRYLTKKVENTKQIIYIWEKGRKNPTGRSPRNMKACHSISTITAK
jgi:hypothetical protein